MFEELLNKIKYDVVTFFTKLEITMPEEAEAIEEQLKQEQTQDQGLDFVHDDAAGIASDSTDENTVDGFTPEALKPFKRDVEKVGRNEPCPCGSGKKYKQCHGKLV